VLLRSLIQPGTDLQHIQSKQESLREIASNDRLRRALKDFVHEYANGERALYKFFNKGLRASFPYPDIKRAKASAVNMVKIMQTIPNAESSYLRALISHLYSYRGSSIDQMMKGSIYKTFSGLKSEKEIGFFTLKLKFTPRCFTEWLLAGPAVTVVPYVLDKAGFGLHVSSWLPGMGLAWTCAYVFYGLFIKPIRDTEKFIEPFRKRCVFDNRFSRAVDAVGIVIFTPSATTRSLSRAIIHWWTGSWKRKRGNVSWLNLMEMIRLTGSSLEFQEWPMQTEWPQELIFPEKTGITI
jgi:mRNA-degrading endonuclease HigB of HigAB toxin-antitoxin module